MSMDNQLVEQIIGENLRFFSSFILFLFFISRFCAVALYVYPVYCITLKFIICHHEKNSDLERKKKKRYRNIQKEFSRPISFEYENSNKANHQMPTDSDTLLNSFKFILDPLHTIMLRVVCMLRM